MDNRIIKTGATVMNAISLVVSGSVQSSQLLNFSINMAEQSPIFKEYAVHMREYGHGFAHTVIFMVH
jgi:hypothetical protein